MKRQSIIVPPNYLVAISGVAHVSGSGNNTTLHYTDGTTETGSYYPEKHGTEFLNIVSAIQAQRCSVRNVCGHARNGCRPDFNCGAK